MHIFKWSHTLIDVKIFFLSLYSENGKASRRMCFFEGPILGVWREDHGSEDPFCFLGVLHQIFKVSGKPALAG